MNSSINHLIGTFARLSNTGGFLIHQPNLVCIDTSNNRIGINTLDPSYAIHVVSNTNNSSNDETISSNRLKSDRLEINGTIIFKNLPISDHDLVTGQLYNSEGFLKIK